MQVLYTWCSKLFWNSLRLGCCFTVTKTLVRARRFDENSRMVLCCRLLSNLEPERSSWERGERGKFPCHWLDNRSEFRNFLLLYYCFSSIHTNKKKSTTSFSEFWLPEFLWAPSKLEELEANNGLLTSLTRAKSSSNETNIRSELRQSNFRNT